MKATTLLLALALACTSPAAFAAKKPKEGKAGGRGDLRTALKAADKNQNHTIDADEVAELNDRLAKADANSALKKLDRNSDGKLNDEEVKAINARMGKGKEGKGGAKKKKKNT